MICPNCKAEIADESKFCTRCGTKIEKAAAPEPVKEPVKEEPAKEAAKAETEVKCINCGATLKPGAKFCTKCGTNQQAGASANKPPVQPTANTAPKAAQPAFQPIQSNSSTQTAKPTPQAAKPAQQKPSPAPQAAKPAQQKPTPASQADNPAPRKKNMLPVIVIVVCLLFVLLLAGGCVAVIKILDVDPIEMLSGLTDKDGKDDKKKKDEDEVEESKEQPEEKEESSEEEKADPALLDEVDDLVEEAKKANKNSSYEDAIEKALSAVNRYVEIAEENHLEEEARDKVSDAFDIAAKATITYCSSVEKQEVGNASYKQIINTIEPVLAAADSLAEKGYEVKTDSLKKFYDGIIPYFRDAYIEKINEITEREQWSRDEAWAYAEQAYATQKDGKTVLFDENDQDDPLRLRYIYCLARISQKRCENGIAEGTLSQEDAFNAMVAILEETDYNLLILQDIITYGTAAGKDISDYRAAYNAIIDVIKQEQNLSIVNSGVNSGTSVDIKSFWYFNDLDGADDYKVDIHNGTTRSTREWIRGNIPSYVE